VRAYIVGVIVTLGLVGVAKRAWSLQIDQGALYHELAEHQHELRLEIPAPRGDIVDASGRPLAVSADVDSVWANPHDVRDVAGTAEKLAAILGHGGRDLCPAGSAAEGRCGSIDEETLESKLAGDHKFVWLARHVAPEVAHAIASAKLLGIEVTKEPRRWYPGKSVAGPVIGRADVDGKGVDGIELSMNDQLAGQRTGIAALRDARGHTMLSDGVGHALPGATVHLTLDRTIQSIAESALADQIVAKKAKSGVVVVLDIATSRVLAMASSPTYDPNNDETRGARNLAVTDAFEAGSVMKVFSIATALEAGVVDPSTGFEIGNAYVVNPRVKAIRDVEFFPYLTTREIIKYSSNIGAAKIGMRLGADKLYAGLKQFGFGKRTGVELPGERTGRVRSAASWRDVDLAHIAFGYGITVTPLQLAAAFASIASHGVYREPRIVDSVIDGDGNAIYKAETVSHQAVSAKVADEMMKMLISVFDKSIPGGPIGGTAKTIDVPGFRCAGKTGTAHKYDPAIHAYSESKYLASFAGIAPADHPRIVVITMIDEPDSRDYYGASVSGPVFARVASETLRYLGVPGDPLAPLPAGAKPAAPPAAVTDAPSTPPNDVTPPTDEH
jgi:cell division protein FtsI (penicillin-binding protein 3)